MLYNPPVTTALCVTAVLLHTAGVIICSTIVPDTNPTPPLEFPSDNLHVRIVQATDSSVNNNLTKAQFMYYENDVETTSQSLGIIDRQLNNIVFKSWPPINVITKISENYTENTYYNNRIEENWSSITLTLLVLTVIAIVVLTCSILFLKKVQNLKISKRQLLLEDCDESAMSDLIRIQHV